MNPTIILFVFSLAIIFIMIVGRFYEMKSGRTEFAIHIKKSGDRFFSSIWFAITKILARIKNRAHSSATALPHKTKLTLSMVWGRIRNKVDKYFDRFHRSHHFGKRGPISHYWKSVSDHKDSLKDKK